MEKETEEKRKEENKEKSKKKKTNQGNAGLSLKQASSSYVVDPR